MAGGFQEVEGRGDTGYHYIGRAKTLTHSGKAFADTNLSMMKGRP